MSLKIQDGEAMNIFLARVRKAARDLKNAGRPINDDEVAYQMLTDLPANYDGIVQSLYQLSDAEFTSKKVEEALVAESHRISHLSADNASNQYLSAFAAGQKKTKTFIQRQNNENKM